MPDDQIREFGVRVDGENYRLRPGSYAVILKGEDLAAVVRTPQGVFLPGGGANPGESAEEALHREVLEECGRVPRILSRLGMAIEYVAAAGEGFFAKQCTFFLAELAETEVNAPEADHELVWMPIATAMDEFTHQSQAWAVAQARSIISKSARQSSRQSVSTLPAPS